MCISLFSSRFSAHALVFVTCMVFISSPACATEIAGGGVNINVTPIPSDKPISLKAEPSIWIDALPGERKQCVIIAEENGKKEGVTDAFDWYTDNARAVVPSPTRDVVKATGPGKAEIIVGGVL